MIAFIASLVITGIMMGIVVFVARRRPPGQPLTWGEAFVAAAFLFALLLMVYGIVPDRWLRWADNELRWRSDKLGIPTGPLHYLGVPNPMFSKGVFIGKSRGKVVLTAQDLRDVVAAGIYIVFLGLQIWAWGWWQKRGKKVSTTPELETSAYGRPLVRKV